MEDLLIATLENAFGYTVQLQGSFLPDEPYPDHFFTYWNDATDGDGFYSNEETALLWQYSLNFYSKNPEEVSRVLNEAKKELKKVGFIVRGGGYSVMSDEPTHTGRGITVLYRQNI